MKLIIAIFLMSAHLNARPIGLGTIYGPDDRQDVGFILDPAKRDLTLSVASRVPFGNLTKMGGRYRPTNTRTLGALRPFCDASTPFLNQSPLGDCTGFLVGPNLLATAGHCAVKGICPQALWVFGHTSDNTREFSADSVYGCKRVVAQEYEMEGADYAVLELDREVVNRPILKLAQNNGPASDVGLFIIGHPTGLPMKIAEGAKVYADAGSYFTANLDSFHGNSGSPVFNAKSLEVEGILVRGKADDFLSDRGCRVLNVCNQEGTECSVDSDIELEHSSKISFVREVLQTLGH